MVLKLTASIIGGGVSATFQTSDDGGTTWFDVGRTSIVSDANGGRAQWLSIPVEGTGIRTTTQGPSSTVGGTTSVSILGAIGVASSLGQLEVSGLPLLGLQNRVLLRYTAAVSGNDLSRVQVRANSQASGN